MHQAIHSLIKTAKQDFQKTSKGKKINKNPAFFYTAFLFITSSILFGFSDTTKLLKDYWVLDSSYTHGPLILCISAYLLFWHHRVKLLNAEALPTAHALPFFLASIFFWWSSKVLNIQVFQVAALPMILLTSYYCLWGKNISRITFFPMLFFYLAIPIWTIILNPLQDMTIWINSRLIDITRIPAFIEGTNVQIPAGAFSIEQGCAGLKYLLSSLSTVILMGHLSSASSQAKYLAVLLAIFTALIANWIRVFLIIIIGHYSNMQHEIVHDHSNFGWLIFAVFFLPLLFICHKILPVNTKEPTQYDIYKPSFHAKKKLVSQLILATIIISFVLITSKVFSPNNINTLDLPDNLTLPIADNNWNGPILISTKNNLPDFKGFSHYVTSVYKRFDLIASVTIIKYQKQKQGAELIHYENQLFDAKQWQPTDQRKYRLVIDSDKKHTVMGTELISDIGSKRLIYYWYQIGAYSTSSKVLAKLLQIPALMNRRADARLYFISIDCRGSCENEKNIIQPLIMTILESAKS